MSHRDDEVRVLLEGAAGSGRELDIAPDDTWSRGRRRRSGKRVGAGAVGLLGAAAVVGLVWQTGLLGGGGQEIGVATLPSAATTFVLAAPDAPGQVPGDLAGLRVPEVDELVGTEWVLLDQVWGSVPSAGGVVGSEAETTFSFADEGSQGWGFAADQCGGGWFQEDLSLSERGEFPEGDLSTDDQGCLEPAQTSEDFWIDVLGHGGSLHLLGDDWLLLSVDTSWAGVQEPPPVLDDRAARLDFVREGVDPTTVDTSLPERAPTNEELAGTGWTLLEWMDGGGVLADLLTDPSGLHLQWAEEFPSSLALAYDDCELVTVQTEGVDASGGTVAPEDRELITEGSGSCDGASGARPVLVDAFGEGAQFTLVGEDLLVLRLPLPDRAEPSDASEVTGAPDDLGAVVVDPGTELAWPDADSWNLERGGAIVTGARFGAHDGFDRVVIDLEADAQPGWMIRYENPAGGQAFGPTPPPIWRNPADW